MKAGNGVMRWRTLFGVLAVGVFACSLTLAGTRSTKSGATRVSKLRAGALMSDGGQVGIPVSQIPFAVPTEGKKPQDVLVYERSRTPLLWFERHDEGWAGMIAARSGGPTGCELDEECDPCVDCYEGVCDIPSGTCISSYTPLCEPCSNGVYCDGLERCDGIGNCILATGQKMYICVGGAKDGQGCDPDQNCPEGTCVAGTCDGGPRHGLECDCPDGNCEADWFEADPCADHFPTMICNEEPPDATEGECLPPCDTDADCDDGKACTGVEVCVKDPTTVGSGGVCIGGSSEGNACTENANCPGDGAYCGGVCRAPAELPCGEGAVCTEGPPMTCGNGRCCEADGAEWICTRVPKTQCTSPKLWLGVGDWDPSTPADEGDCDLPAGPEAPQPGEDFGCPKYESGMVDGGMLLEDLGPAGVAPCYPYHEIGDDYKLSNCEPGVWYEVTTFRYVGGFEEGTGERMRVTFYDTQGLFIEDTITRQFVDAGIYRRTVVFSEKPVIPCEGYVALRPAVTFTPDNLAHWMSTDQASVHAGTNKPDVMWINGAPSANVLTEGPGILAFEIVGEKAGAPLGACCSHETGACELKLPWICEEESGFFQGIGTNCKVCLDHPFVSCLVSDPDCVLCIGGANDSQPCPNGDSDCASPGYCNTEPNCVPSPPACQITACCDPNTGTCSTVMGGFCSETTGTECISDDDCPGEETCEANCPAGTVGQGFGTNCVPNCCEQPIFDGYDDCALARTGVVYIPVPSPDLDPITVTFTSDNKQADFGDVTNGTCDTGIFDELGGTRDRGWWHAFSLDAGEHDCSDIRIDMCCTDPIHQPQWAFLYTDCDPCGGTINNTIAPSPIGSGLTDNDRGLPFCTAADNLWQTFTRLRNGIYYHPIYTATGGHFGQYQLHITARACAIAACCLPDDDVDYPCKELNVLDCEERGGYWLGFGNIPSDVAPMVACTVGEWQACEYGSCCLGPGECQDNVAPGIPCNRANPEATCMDSDLCDTLDSLFIGGAMCDWPKKPCPTCAISGDNNCQLPDCDVRNYNIMSDLSVPPQGAVAADDFVPTGDTLAEICMWGVYMDDKALASKDQNCIGTVEAGTESFRIRVYRDAVAHPDLWNDPQPGQPGELVGEAIAAGSNVLRAPVPCTYLNSLWPELKLQGYTLYLDNPITGLEPNETHWLEIAANRHTVSDRDTCYFHWYQSYLIEGVGNDYSVNGTNDRTEQAGAIGSGYVHGSARASDMTFCLGGLNQAPLDFTAPEVPLGSCCDCEDLCVNDTTRAECSEDGDILGVWNRGMRCTDDGVCFCEGNDCSGGTGLTATGLVCSSLGGGGGALPVGDGIHGFDTSCYTTDGPVHPDVSVPGNVLGKDIWYAYTATCTGKMVASMCMSGTGQGSYDSYIAMYHDPSHSNECLCPGSSISTQIALSDEGCNGLPDEGSGTMNWIVFPGECYLVRLGGWTDGGPSEAGAGPGLVDIACLAATCYISTSPLPDRLYIEGASPPDPINQKVRYLSFEIAPEDAGRWQNIRVTFEDLPVPYDVWNGVQMWVQEPRTFCENSGQGSPPPAGCGPSGGLPLEFEAHTLGCDAIEGGRDWSLDGVIDVYHEGIVPGGVYHVQTIDDSCLLTEETAYTEPLVVTMSAWGDVVQDLSTDPPKPPDGSVGVTTDVTGVLDKFKNKATFLPLTTVRADIEPATPDQKVNITTDVTFCLDAFRGFHYPPASFPEVGPRPCP